jgi:membrane-bound lytic murein transglycosylase D
VAKGEAVSTIAAKYGVSSKDLMAWNKLTPKSVIKVGDELSVHATAKNQTAPGQTDDPPASAVITHKVAKGEAVSTIAAKYGVSSKDLMAWNKLTPRSVIRVGDALVVHAPAKNQETATPDHGEAKGTIRLAKREVSETTTPEPKTESASTEDNGGQKTTHVVGRGQNPTTIARRYGVSISDLYKWNGWSKQHVLQVGDKVTVYKD